MREWENNKGSALVLAYETYEALINLKSSVQFMKNPDMYRDVKKILLSTDIVVCDEGHIINSSVTATARALLQLTTKRRIILTGTPVQNNLTERKFTHLL